LVGVHPTIPGLFQLNRYILVVFAEICDEFPKLLDWFIELVFCYLVP